MSVIDIEPITASPDEPERSNIATFDGVSDLDGTCTPRSDWSILYDIDPDAARDLWNDIGKPMVSDGFDPLAIYLEVFQRSVANRKPVAKEPDGTPDAPTVPSSEVVNKLGTVSMSLRQIRASLQTDQSPRDV